MASPQPERPHPDERYYSAHELDVYPRLRQPLPSEPHEVAAHVGARVLVAVALDATGNVEEVSFVGGDANGAEEQVIANALRHAGFFPARKNGRPVKSRIVIGIEGAAGPVAGFR